MNKVFQKTESQNLSDDELVLISGGAGKGLSDVQAALVDLQLTILAAAGQLKGLSGKPRG